MTDNMHAWKSDEYGYCADLVAFRGSIEVGETPATIARYLRLQASQAYCDGEYELSSRLWYAATCIDDHTPDWRRAEEALEIPIYGTNGGSA